MCKSNHFEIKSELAQVKVMASYFHDFCNENDIDNDISGLFELALVESLNNIIIHAYDKAGGHDIQAQFEKTESQVIVSLTDFGKEFINKNNNKTDKPDPVNTKLDELSEGSWGLDLIKTITDDYIQFRENDSNKLIMKKNLAI